MATSRQVEKADRPSHYREWGLPHQDTVRAAQYSYVRYEDAQGQAAERRDRVRAGATVMLLAPGPIDDLIDALGIPEDEMALAQRFLTRMQEPDEVSE